jgi:hypothetical protein
MPVAADALSSGEVSSAAVSLLASAQEAAPGPFARAEDGLVEAARSLPVMKLRSAVAHWRATADADRAVEDEERRFGAGASTSRPRWTGWCASTASSIRRPVRP